MYMTIKLLLAGGGHPDSFLPHHESKWQACIQPYWVGS